MISRTSTHALQALVELAEAPEGSYLGASAIARKIGAPPNYLGKLLQSLAGEALLLSQKGFGGGFRLARGPRDITLYEVVEPIEHVSRWNGCFLGRAECGGESPCRAHEQWKRVRDTYLDFLKETTIADLAAGEAEIASAF